MLRPLFSRAMMLFIGFVLISAFGVTTLVGQQKTKVAGRMTAAWTKQEIMEVGDVENHLCSLGKAEGVNVSTGATEFMDGAEVVNLAMVDVVKGNGSHHGYVTVTKRGDTYIAKWEGKVVTAMTAGGTPSTSFEGTFTWIKGTGQLGNIQGGGTYKGKYISKNIYVVDWEGEYIVKK